MDRRANRPHGFGRAILENNTIHEGVFINGTLSKFGRSFYPDGSTYIGGYDKGKREGEGVFSSYKFTKENAIFKDDEK